jgi:hypothetical protein
VDGINTNNNVTSQTPLNQNVIVFAASSDPGRPSNGRLAFYSIGEAIDLALLDARVSTLIAALQFGINTGLAASDYDADTVAYVNRGYAAGGSLA